jgi:hypothetical protein
MLLEEEYYGCEKGEYQSGQLGRTVNPLTYVFTGSNPVSPTLIAQMRNFFSNFAGLKKFGLAGYKRE